MAGITLALIWPAVIGMLLVAILVVRAIVRARWRALSWDEQNRRAYKIAVKRFTDDLKRQNRR